MYGIRAPLMQLGYLYVKQVSYVLSHPDLIDLHSIGSLKPNSSATSASIMMQKSDFDVVLAKLDATSKKKAQGQEDVPGGQRRAIPVLSRHLEFDDLMRSSEANAQTIAKPLAAWQW